MLNPVNGSLLQPSRIYDRSGTHVLMVLAAWDEPRKYVFYNPNSPNHIPDTLVRATVALSDPGFWTQPGNRIESLTNPDEHAGLTQMLVFRLLLWNEPSNWRRAMREQILRNASAQVLKEIALRDGMKTLRMAGLEKAKAGITALDEVFRMAGAEI